MRGVIRFLFAEGLNLRKLFVECRLNAVVTSSRSKIYEWAHHFKKGRTSVCDEERSGRLSTSRTENSIQTVERMVGENRRITVDDTAEASIWLAQ
jgi:hypothetical protein